MSADVAACRRLAALLVDSFSSIRRSSGGSPPFFLVIRTCFESVCGRLAGGGSRRAMRSRVSVSFDESFFF